jgi:hypothetical protein
MDHSISLDGRQVNVLEISVDWHAPWMRSAAERQKPCPGGRGGFTKGLTACTVKMGKAEVRILFSLVYSI